MVQLAPLVCSVGVLKTGNRVILTLLVTDSVSWVWALTGGGNDHDDMFWNAAGTLGAGRKRGHRSGELGTDEQHAQAHRSGKEPPERDARAPAHERQEPREDDGDQAHAG